MHIVKENPPFLNHAGITAYIRAVTLDPTDAYSYASLAGLYRKTGDMDLYEEAATAARKMMVGESEYNKACLESICNNEEAALDLLEVAILTGQVRRSWARQDPDLAFVRPSERFQRLVGGL